MLLVGPPGLGKTTLAQIVARELGVNFRSTSGPVIAKAGDLAAQLTSLEERDVLFIDEIHRLNPAVEEILYPAMEDFQLDLMIGQGPAARSVKIDLSKFTLVGATTRAGLLTTPLRDRFGIPIRLQFYTVAELELIVRRGARVFGIGIAPDGANEIARRSRGTPRIAGRLLRRVRDFALVDGADTITRAIADSALKQLDVDDIGLDVMDRRYLDIVALSFGGGPVGVETISAALSEPRDANFGGEHSPLHLHRLDLMPRETLRLEAAAVDRVAYVWSGGIRVGGHDLGAGSSMIVERGGAALVEAGNAPASVLLFAGTQESGTPGGGVHLLPAASVPRSGDLGGASGVGGAIHADAARPGTPVWLHENTMPGVADDHLSDPKAGVHSHSEDEIIFVTEGQIRLGAKLYGAGTALLIAADTLYGFTPGPEGLRFVNFRAAMPGDIRFANGTAISETGYWRERLPRPVYVDI